MSTTTSPPATRSALVEFAAWCGRHASLDGAQVRRVMRLARWWRNSGEQRFEGYLQSEARGYTVNFAGGDVRLSTPTGGEVVVP